MIKSLGLVDYYPYYVLPTLTDVHYYTQAARRVLHVGGRRGKGKKKKKEGGKERKSKKERKEPWLSGLLLRHFFSLSLFPGSSLLISVFQRGREGGRLVWFGWLVLRD